MILEPLPKESQREIALIIRNIEKGTYRYYQGDWHKGTECGTAHCIAGWKTVRDTAKKTKTSIGVVADTPPTNLSNLIKDTLLDISNWYDDEGAHAQRQWQLTAHEAARLFSVEQTLDGMKEMLSHWANNERLVFDEWVKVID